jgi:hypothetical protein
MTIKPITVTGHPEIDLELAYALKWCLNCSALMALSHIGRAIEEMSRLFEKDELLPGAADKLADWIKETL